MPVLNEAGDHMVQETLRYNPVLLKVIDEVLCNAVDNHQRHPDKTSQLKVNMDKHSISIWNNGPTVPVKIDPDTHKTEYLPTVVFSILHSGSNFNDEIKRKVGGRHGLGSKLANIYSLRFEVECNDVTVTGNHFKQAFVNHMKSSVPPAITKAKGTGDWTKITLFPDFARFKLTNAQDQEFLMKEFDADITKLIRKRVFDLAGTTDKKFKCYFNDALVKVNNFKQYISLFMVEAKDHKEEKEEEKDDDVLMAEESKRQEKKTGPVFVYEQFSHDWEVGVSLSESGHFEEESFVNHISTMDGGTHVDHVWTKLSKLLVAELAKRKDSKKLNITAAMLRHKVRLFINCMIENPVFKTQTKVELTSMAKDFGSNCAITESFAKRVLKNTGLLAQIIKEAQDKEDAQLSKKLNGKKSKRVRNEKLEDAHLAGTKRSVECTLILTEGTLLCN